MIDAIRRKQTDGVLNYGRDMNLKVLNLERKQVAYWGPEGDTGESKNQTS